MKIYVANTAKDNEGRLGGNWIELSLDPEDLPAPKGPGRCCFSRPLQNVRRVAPPDFACLESV